VQKMNTNHIINPPDKEEKCDAFDWD